jgi:hypothetical protein
MGPGMVIYTGNPCTWGTEVGGSQVSDQAGLHGETLLGFFCFAFAFF